MNADWYRDPTGQFDFRYFDGSTWTNDVSRGGVAQRDLADIGGLTPPQLAPDANVAAAAPQDGYGASSGDAAPGFGGGVGGYGAPAAGAAPQGPTGASTWPTPRPVPGPRPGSSRTGLPGPMAWAVAIVSFQAFSVLLYGIVLTVGGNSIRQFNNGSCSTYGSSSYGCDNAGNTLTGLGLVLLLVGVGLLAAAVATAMALNWGRVINYVAQGVYLLIALYAASKSNSGLATLVLFAFPILVISLLSAASTRNCIATRANLGRSR